MMRPVSEEWAKHAPMVARLPVLNVRSTTPWKYYCLKPWFRCANVSTAMCITYIGHASNVADRVDLLNVNSGHCTKIRLEMRVEAIQGSHR